MVISKVSDYLTHNSLELENKTVSTSKLTPYTAPVLPIGLSS